MSNTFDVSMKDCVIVFSTCAESEEILASFRAKLAEELNFDVSVGSMES